MIVFDLSCSAGHRFEGWFGSSEDYSAQKDRGLVQCPQCGCENVSKAPMAPSVPAKSSQRSRNEDTQSLDPSADQAVAGGKIPAEVRQAMKALMETQSKALANSRYVGEGFAEETRAMHYGEKDLEAVHGKATLAEAKELLDEGVPVAPLLAPFTPPDELN